MPYFKRLQSLKVEASNVTRLGYFLCCGRVGEVNLSFDNLTKIEGETLKNIVLDRLVINLPRLTSITNNTFYNIYSCTYIDANMPMLEALGQNVFRECQQLKELHLNIPKVKSQSYSVYNNGNLRICHLKGMQCSFNIGSLRLEIGSVKYMLDNCQAREDGASYTLSLNANVKASFLAKCDEDAEYAASLASANAKGLTIA